VRRRRWWTAGHGGRFGTIERAGCSSERRFGTLVVVVVVVVVDVVALERLDCDCDCDCDCDWLTILLAAPLFYSVIAPTGSVTEANGRERAIRDGVDDGKCLSRRK
jgi:hypothetical protein